MPDLMETRTLSKSLIPMGATAVLVILVLGIAGWFLYSEVVELRTQVTTLEATTSALQGELELAAADSAKALEEGQLLASSIDDLELDLADGNGRLVRDLGAVSRSVSGLDSDLSGFMTEMDDRLIGIGRCLYHEAERHRYNYWFLTDFLKGEYITECD